MDWKTLISELLAVGWTQPRLAQECGVGQSTISLLATGATKDPRYSTGQKLRELHQAIAASGEGAAAAPIGDAHVQPDRRHDHATAATYENTLADRRMPVQGG